MYNSGSISMEEKTKTWSWIQADGSVFRVISQPKKGIIEVFNQQGQLVLRKTGLTSQQVKLIEDSFLDHVADTLPSTMSSTFDDFDPMVV